MTLEKCVLLQKSGLLAVNAVSICIETMDPSYPFIDCIEIKDIVCPLVKQTTNVMHTLLYFMHTKFAKLKGTFLLRMELELKFHTDFTVYI